MVNSQFLFVWINLEGYFYWVWNNSRLAGFSGAIFPNILKESFYDLLAFIISVDTCVIFLTTAPVTVLCPFPLVVLSVFWSSLSLWISAVSLDASRDVFLCSILLGARAGLGESMNWCRISLEPSCWLLALWPLSCPTLSLFFSFPVECLLTDSFEFFIFPFVFFHPFVFLDFIYFFFPEEIMISPDHDNSVSLFCYI